LLASANATQLSVDGLRAEQTAFAARIVAARNIRKGKRMREERWKARPQFIVGMEKDFLR
jgi:hypothetical protein